MALLSYLEFREEFPYVVNKKVNWHCTTANCNENPLDGCYDVTPRVFEVAVSWLSRRQFVTVDVNYLNSNNTASAHDWQMFRI